MDAEYEILQVYGSTNVTTTKWKVNVSEVYFSTASQQIR